MVGINNIKNCVQNWNFYLKTLGKNLQNYNFEKYNNINNVYKQ